MQSRPPDLCRAAPRRYRAAVRAAVGGGAFFDMRAMRASWWICDASANRPHAELARSACRSTHSLVAQEDESRRAVAALVEQSETRRRDELLLRCHLDDDQRARREPARGGERGQRRGGEVLAIGRIEKRESGGFRRGRGAEGVAGENRGMRGLAERGEVGAKRGKR